MWPLVSVSMFAHNWQALLHYSIGTFIPDADSIYGMRQAPCQDHCQELKAQREEEENLHSQGRILKKQYIEAAKQMKNPGSVSAFCNHFVGHNGGKSRPLVSITTVTTSGPCPLGGNGWDRSKIK